jgi:hypothetical protein
MAMVKRLNTSAASCGGMTDYRRRFVDFKTPKPPETSQNSGAGLHA